MGSVIATDPFFFSIEPVVDLVGALVLDFAEALTEKIWVSGELI